MGVDRRGWAEGVPGWVGGGVEEDGEDEGGGGGDVGAGGDGEDGGGAGDEGGGEAGGGGPGWRGGHGGLLFGVWWRRRKRRGRGRWVWQGGCFGGVGFFVFHGWFDDPASTNCMSTSDLTKSTISCCTIRV